MKAVVLEPGTIPTRPGEVALTDRPVPRPWQRPEPAVELMVCDPTGRFYALVPEVHTWSGVDDGRPSVSPSIVAPSGGYHGYLTDGVWR